MITIYIVVSLVILGIILGCFRGKINKGIIPIACFSTLISIVICTIIGCWRFFHSPLDTNVTDKFYVMLDEKFEPTEDYLLNTNHKKYRPSDIVEKSGSNRIDSIMIGDKDGIILHKVERENNSLGLFIPPSYTIEEKTFLVLTKNNYETLKSFLE